MAAVTNSAAGAAIEVFGAGVGSVPPTDGTVLFESDSSEPFYLYWTPDGAAVSFLTQEASSLTLRSAPADGSAVATTLREGAPMYWAWERPGRMLVHTGADTDAFLGAVGADGGTVSTVEAVPGSFRAPSVSADGRYAAYAVAGQGGPASVVVAASDGSTTFDVPVFGPAAVGFAPSGPQLAFIGADDGDPLVPLPYRSAASDRCRNGRRPEVPDRRRRVVLLVTRRANDRRDRRAAQVARRTRSSGSARLRPPSGATIRRPRPDDDAPGVDVSLVFVDVASGTGTRPRLIHLSPLFVNQVMPYFDQYALSHRVWAPDSSAILLPVIGDDDEASLAVMPADGSAPRTLAPGLMGFWSP